MSWPNELEVSQVRDGVLPDISDNTVIFHIEHSAKNDLTKNPDRTLLDPNAPWSLTKEASQRIVRQLLGYYLNRSADTIKFVYGDKGKPYVLENPLFYNVSDTTHALFIALNLSSEIGLDIEPNDREFNYPMLVKRHFSPQENEQYLGLLERERRFWTLFGWTRKEALGKAMGRGIRYPMREISVMAPFPQSACINYDTTAYTISSFRLTPFNAIGSIALRNPSAPAVTKLIHIGAEQWQNLMQ